jgi:cell division protein FtsQ
VPVAGFRVSSRQPDSALSSVAAVGPPVHVRPYAEPVAGAPERFPRPRARAVTQRSYGRLKGPVIGAALTGALAFSLLTSFGNTTRKPSSILSEVDRIAEMLGWGLTQVELSGHKFTPDTAVLDTLDLEHVRSLASFNAPAARDRIERLPWVATASITRLLPDGLAITITERKPFAVWQLGARETLIDAGGRRLAAIRPGAAPDLPRVAGPGAPDVSAELFTLLARYPEIAARLVAAERIGLRRWTLRLTGDLDVLLPPILDDRPFETLLRGAAGQRLLDAGAGQLDLRLPTRIVALPTYRPARPQPTARLKQS